MEFLPEKCKKHFNALDITEQTAREIMKRFDNEINLGLGAKTHKKAVVKCFPTYVQDLPTGQEKGKFLALDLGGTNFRVLVVTLDGGNFDMQSKIYAIPQEIMKGACNMLFDHIASCLADFIKEQALEETDLPLGFTFSFPLTQMGLTKGILERWNKGFNVSGVVGKDVVQLLEEAIRKRGDIKIQITAVIGFIVGSNACYVEKVEKVELFDGDKSKPYVIINTESGAFGDDGKLNFIRTEFDKEVDKKSINKGKQINEKLVSGMYLGELVRVTLCKLTKEKALFGGKINDKLKKKDLFTTVMISEIAADAAGIFDNTKKILEEEFDYPNATENECAIVQLVCEKYIQRAAHMCAIVLASLINRIGESKITVGVDGSVYRFHPQFHDLMVKFMTPLVNPGIEFDLMLSEDGSGRGAALVAATAASALAPSE
ncbi:hypothetical protein L9F63_011598 [Diploptera punctata]|uniref:Phosphotransferase n=1 Tax=Diploptera punctata TaxID=6984 RepID=A0AAD8AF40_DIPPU|nr:hypothetical protein L9F63_011598 [Diploptera punctata]